ncbi:MAG: superinfection immunity protein [Acidithiobacillus sp.]|uniref:superinfection immunity protein n=1 Tax=Acidithiobacillus sp. TaxID=1872118 RepID=UPI003D065115
MLHWITDSRAGFVALLVIAFVVATGVYVLPALIAWSMGSSYRMPITLLNLLLGWTDGIGMACRPDLGSHDRQRWEF